MHLNVYNIITRNIFSLSSIILLLEALTKEAVMVLRNQVKKQTDIT